ncbi:MAG TPA: hypothetical protein VI358_11145 [Pseudolabrys sp.]
MAVDLQCFLGEQRGNGVSGVKSIAKIGDEIDPNSTIGVGHKVELCTVEKLLRCNSVECRNNQATVGILAK